MLNKFRIPVLVALLCLNFHSVYADDGSRSRPLPKKNIILPDGYHLLKARGLDGGVIELEEGSQFRVVSGDREIVKGWEQDAILTIKVNAYPKWISGGTYCLLNEKAGNYVRAEYDQGPVTTHPFAKTIYHVDTHYGEIYVVDGRGNKSKWQVNENDLSKIKKWGYQIDPKTRKKLYDTVLVGCNQSSGYFSWLFLGGSSDEHILISYENSAAVTHVRANRKELN